MEHAADGYRTDPSTSSPSAASSEQSQHDERSSTNVILPAGERDTRRVKVVRKLVRRKKLRKSVDVPQACEREGAAARRGDIDRDATTNSWPARQRLDDDLSDDDGNPLLHDIPTAKDLAECRKEGARVRQRSLRGSSVGRRGRINDLQQYAYEQLWWREFEDAAFASDRDSIILGRRPLEPQKRTTAMQRCCSSSAAAGRLLSDFRPLLRGSTGGSDHVLRPQPHHRPPQRFHQSKLSRADLEWSCASEDDDSMMNFLHQASTTDCQEESLGWPSASTAESILSLGRGMTYR